MNTPMNTPGPFGSSPFEGRGFGFGFSPEDRKTLHEQRRQARREFRDHVREHRGDAGFGRGFGPGFGFGPGNFGPGFGFGPGGRRGGPRGGGRGRRGDVRAAILKLLTDRPMHGYEMIQEINERSQQLWKPSPGSVYPTLQLLVDEGRAAAEKIETAPWDEIASDADPGALGLRNAVGQLMGAVAQSAHAATPEQQQRIVDIVNNARREIYSILGEN